MITGSKQTIDESAVLYQSRTVLADLSNDISATKTLNKVNDQILKATKIRLWLKAFDYKLYLTDLQRDKIKYALIDISGVFDLPVAPVLGKVTQPAVLVNTSIKVRRKTA